MLTFEEAKKIGIRACVDKLGYDFVKKMKRPPVPHMEMKAITYPVLSE